MEWRDMTHEQRIAVLAFNKGVSWQLHKGYEKIGKDGTGSLEGSEIWDILAPTFNWKDEGKS